MGDKILLIKESLPRTGIPIVKITGSYVGASSAYTELGPPEMITALKKTWECCNTSRSKSTMRDFKLVQIIYLLVSLLIQDHCRCVQWKNVALNTQFTHFSIYNFWILGTGIKYSNSLRITSSICTKMTTCSTCVVHVQNQIPNSTVKTETFKIVAKEKQEESFHSEAEESSHHACSKVCRVAGYSRGCWILCWTTPM